MFDFFHYWSTVGWHKVFRICWFYFVFEFTRYVLLEFVVLSFWVLKRKYFKKNKREEARRQLWLERPFVSVIVPGKNEGKHIFKLTKSLKEQTYRNFELIIIDDGSDDQTPIICKSLLKNGLIDQFFRNDVRGGKASAANMALRFSKGKYVIHLDADCSYDNDAIENILIPFYYEANIGAVGGNVIVRNWDESLATTMQALEYQNVISTGRVVTSELGIYKIVSGAFGAFRKDLLDRLGGWDIGPGLDGDITVKIRKLGYKIRFEAEAVCQTSAPNTFYKLGKQRRRWDKSLIRFRLRKHKDVLKPNKSFSLSTFIAFLENITFNVILDIKWVVYIVDICVNFTSGLRYIIPLNFMLYTLSNYFKLIVFSVFRPRSNAPVSYFLLYVPLQVFYTGFFLRLVRSYAYIKEIFFKESYTDPWNPEKSSYHAKKQGL